MTDNQLSPESHNPEQEIRNPQSETRNRKGIGGPKTEEGKRRSSMNALKHGLRAKTDHILQMIDENPDDDFMQTLEMLVGHYEPKDPVEHQLVRRIAVCMWRLYLSEKMDRRGRLAAEHRYSPDKNLQRVSDYEKLVDLHLHRAIRTLERKRAMDSREKRRPEGERWYPNGYTNELLSRLNSRSE